MDRFGDNTVDALQSACAILALKCGENWAASRVP
jgi:hypothetical protein